MTTSDVTCRIRVRVPDDKNDEGRLVGISERSGASDEVRKQWVEGITEYIWGSQSNKGARQCIRPWDFLLVSDGSVESLPAAKIEGDISSGMYPAHYRIPPVSIEYLDQQGQIDRQERFAFASLLYEIVSGKKPFERLSSEEVQQRYSNADFPDDVRNLPPAILIAILSFWSLEFSNLVTSPRFRFSLIAAGARSYIKAHPYLFALQLTGVVVSGAALAAPTILGAVGFGVFGPVAGSAAAGWQASIGIVEAGSIFAWCQSAAMGGAAINTIIATGAAGGGVAALTTGAAAAAQKETIDVDDLMRRFIEVYMRGKLSEVRGLSLTE